MPLQVSPKLPKVNKSAIYKGRCAWIVFNKIKHVLKDIRFILAWIILHVIVVDSEEILIYAFANSEKHSFHLPRPWCDYEFENFRCHFRHC